MATRHGLTKLSTNQATEFVAQFYPVDSIFNATTGVLLVNDKQNHAPTEFPSYSLLSCSVGALPTPDGPFLSSPSGVLFKRCNQKDVK